MERILGAVVAEHQNEGYSSMKLALSAAVQGKNATITNDGYYTLAQRVFEHEVKFPGLTEEEEAASFAEALGTEGEVARAHEMRMTARMALLRTDVQEKLRRAVLSVLSLTREPTGVCSRLEDLLLVTWQSTEALCAWHLAWSSQSVVQGGDQSLLCKLAWTVLAARSREHEIGYR